MNQVSKIFFILIFFFLFNFTSFSRSGIAVENQYHCNAPSVNIEDLNFLQNVEFILDEDPGLPNNIFPNYETYLEDGILSITIGIGYYEEKNKDDHGYYDGPSIDDLGFCLIDYKLRSPSYGFEYMGKTNQDTWSYQRTIGYNGGEYKVIIDVITPLTPSPLEKFINAMRNSDVVIYAGHGRSGSGPDFDSIYSFKENLFIADFAWTQDRLTRNPITIWPSSNNHREIIDQNLDKLSFNNNKSQIWFFSSCNSKRYLENMNTKIKRKINRELYLILTEGLHTYKAILLQSLGLIMGLTNSTSFNEISRLLRFAETIDEKDRDSLTMLYNGQFKLHW